MAFESSVIKEEDPTSNDFSLVRRDSAKDMKIEISTDFTVLDEELDREEGHSIFEAAPQKVENVRVRTPVAQILFFEFQIFRLLC